MMRKPWARHSAAAVVLLGTALIPATALGATGSGTASTPSSGSTTTSGPVDSSAAAEALSNVWTVDAPDDVAAGAGVNGGTTGSNSGMTIGALLGTTGQQSSTLTVTDDSEDAGFSGLAQQNAASTSSDDEGDGADLVTSTVSATVDQASVQLGLKSQDDQGSEGEGHAGQGSDDQAPSGSVGNGGSEQSSESVTGTVYGLGDDAHASEGHAHGDGQGGSGQSGATVGGAVYGQNGAETGSEQESESVTAAVYIPTSPPDHHHQDSKGSEDPTNDD